MSKRSTATVREQPVAQATSVSGAFQIRGETFAIETRTRTEIVDLTERVMTLVRKLGIREGLVHVFSMHTTCTLFLNEYQHALLDDIQSYLARIVPADGPWRHNDPAHSDCDRMNADAHLRALLLGHSLTLQVSGGEVVLGTWQRVLMCELDGPRVRSLRVQVQGIE